MVVYDIVLSVCESTETLFQETLINPCAQKRENVSSTLASREFVKSGGGKS